MNSYKNTYRKKEYTEKNKSSKNELGQERKNSIARVEKNASECDLNTMQ